LPHKKLVVIANTGSTTAHFGTIDASFLNKCPTLNPITICNLNGSIMMSTHEADLDLPMLPHAARRIRIVPDLASSLISMVGQSSPWDSWAMLAAPLP
jgi:hypothetical protein